jgi:hypothetical protein
VVLGAFARSPQKSTRRLAAESSVSRLSIMHILKNHKGHPYKKQLLQHFCEDPERQMDFCKWVVNKLDSAANFPSGILFMNEANFYVNGEDNCPNLCNWSDFNLHLMSP